MGRPLGAKTKKPEPTVRKAAGRVGAKGAEMGEVAMVLESSAPPWPKPEVGRNWHLSLREGCQRVTEPILSPLLYKTGTLLTVSEEYRVGIGKCTGEIFSRASGKAKSAVILSLRRTLSRSRLLAASNYLLQTVRA